MRWCGLILQQPLLKEKTIYHICNVNLVVERSIKYEPTESVFPSATSSKVKEDLLNDSKLTNVRMPYSKEEAPAIYPKHAGDNRVPVSRGNHSFQQKTMAISDGAMCKTAHHTWERDSMGQLSPGTEKKLILPQITCNFVHSYN